MPRWLQLWIGATLGVGWFLFVVVGGSYGLSALTHAGEAPFSAEQQTYLRKAYPDGVFESSSRYRSCDGRVWVYFDSRGDTWQFNQQCWRVER